MVNVTKIVYEQVNWTFTISCYRKKLNLICCGNQQIISDCEFIHVESWTKDDSYKSIIFNQVDGKSHSQVLVHDVVVKRLTYEDKEAKGEIVNIYQKPESLINYLLDLCSNEGDWVLDLFSGLSKFYYIRMNFTNFFLNFLCLY